MYIIFLLVCSFVFTTNADTLHLPIKNGMLIPDNPYVHKSNKAASIAPKDDFDVRSCLTGQISGIMKNDFSYSVGIKSDTIIVIYSLLDSMKVKLNDFVQKGDVIGSKAKSSEYNHITLSVFISGKEIEAVDYLVEINAYR